MFHERDRDGAFPAKKVPHIAAEHFSCSRMQAAHLLKVCFEVSKVVSGPCPERGDIDHIKMFFGCVFDIAGVNGIPELRTAKTLLEGAHRVRPDGVTLLAGAF